MFFLALQWGVSWDSWDLRENPQETLSDSFEYVEVATPQVLPSNLTQISIGMKLWLSPMGFSL